MITKIVRKGQTVKNKLKIGIAGYGVVGKKRRFYIDQHPCMKTIAISDKRFPKTDVAADGVKIYPDYRQLLEEQLDVLFVSVPNYLASEATIAGLERGLHVFCEKPPGCTVSDIEKVIEVEKKHQGLVLKYGFNHRYHDSVREALHLIETRELGDIINISGIYGKSKMVSFVGEWRAERKYAGGGILLDQGIHMVDLMRLFCGDFQEVKSFVSNRYWNFDVEDNAYAIMRNEQGKIAMLHSSCTQWQHRFILEIALTEGYLELHGILSGSKSYGEEKLIIGKRNKEFITGTDREEMVTYLEDNSWRDEIFEFADSICNGNKLLFGNSADALATMKLVYRIYTADSEWREAYQITDIEDQGK
jgi:predicted dehydrogenase